MSRKQREINLPCPPFCLAYHTREYVMEQTHVGERQYYRYIKRGLRRAHNGLIRCDWLRAFLADVPVKSENGHTLDTDLCKRGD